MQDSPIFIGVDTGNRCIKTASSVMIAGINSSTQKQVLSNETPIMYRGKYYVTTSNRITYRENKFNDDEYFVLSLFGIAKELTNRGVSFTADGEPPKIVLAVGLPPGHYRRLKEKFRSHFNRGLVEFEYQDVPCHIEIVDVMVLIQGYSAIYADYSRIRTLDSAYIVDIGGYTVDVIALENSNVLPDVCFTKDYFGMIRVYNEAMQEIQEKYEDEPSEKQIDELISNPSFHLDPGMKEIANNAAERTVQTLIYDLRERKINLRMSTGIFVGGGSIRLERFIRKNEGVRDPIIISDICANAKGYELLASKLYRPSVS